jgi:hypothetical protein
MNEGCRCRSFGIGNRMEGKNCGVHPKRRGGQANGNGWTWTEDSSKGHWALATSHLAALIIRGDNWGGREQQI